MTSDFATDLPIACGLSTDDLRARGENVVGPLFARVVEVRELDDGYRFVFPAEAECVHALVAFVLEEQACCPFFTFELTFPSPHQSVWLTLRGGEGVKGFIADTFAASPHGSAP